MIGWNCGAHLGTSIDKKRTPLLCPRWVPGFATSCPDCGTTAPHVRIVSLAKNYGHRPGGFGGSGDIEKTVARSVHNRGPRRGVS